VRDRTAELEAANAELEAFGYSVSHDLRGPLRVIEGFSRMLIEDYGPSLDDAGRQYIDRVQASSQRMAQLIQDLLNLSRITRNAIERRRVDLAAIAREVASELRQSQPERICEFVIPPRAQASGDPSMLRILVENLLGNAWKYTSRHPTARIEFGTCELGGETVYFVKDDGAGFDMEFVRKLFHPFQRLHLASEFDGTGIGLATVERIVRRHGGRVWAEGAVEQGATIWFTLAAGKAGAERAATVRPHDAEGIGGSS
jgi:light-regulated signal transduction histidine kinase (bacteriophytochrome)